MDVTSWLLQVAARRPHVLVVAVPGDASARLALEAALARRGWPAATAPADADILAVAGSAGPDLAAAVDRVWHQLPAPRARIKVVEPGGADGELDRAATELGDRHHQRGDPSATSDDRDHAGRADPVADGEHADGAGHAGHHGHGGGMEMPGGLPMADLGEDRDGLTLDRLHVPLGPVLPDWPAGLVVRVTVQGDVIQEATAEVLDAGHVQPSAQPGGDGVARELDGLARLLGVAGGAGELATPVAELVRTVRRSRTLRWLLRGIPAGRSDVAALLEARLGALEAMLTTPDAPAPHRTPVDDLPELLVGVELAAARLIVAAVDPETDRVPAGQGVRRG